MAAGIGEENSASASRRMQVRLADLIFVVLAVGLATSIARGAERLGDATVSLEGDDDGPARARRGSDARGRVGVARDDPARGMLALVRGRRGGADSSRRTILVKLGWRALAIGLLLSLAMRESWVLRVDPQSLNPRLASELGWPFWYDLREALIPVCTILAMIGIALGMGAGRFFTRPGPARRRPYWLFVPMAGLAAVLFMGLPNREWSTIPQLILLALTAVTNAMHRPGLGLEGSLSERLLRAGIEAVPAALACLWLALLVARDFERTRRAEPWATTIGGGVLRILSLVTALASGVAVAFVAIPTMHPWLFDGYRKLFDVEITAIVVCGFGSFAAGLAARTLVPATGERWSRPMVWLSRGGCVGVLMIVLLLTLDCLPASTQIDPRLPDDRSARSATWFVKWRDWFFERGSGHGSSERRRLARTRAARLDRFDHDRGRVRDRVDPLAPARVSPCPSMRWANLPRG